MATMTATTTDIVTPSQIGKCTKIIASTGNFYLVENERGDVDERGDVIEYKVEALRINKHCIITCTCKAGARGIPCKHIRWAKAAAAEEREALALIEKERKAARLAREAAAARARITTVENKLRACGFMR